MFESIAPYTYESGTADEPLRGVYGDDSFLDMLTDGLLVVDPGGTVVRSNNAASRLLGEDRVTGKQVRSLFAPEQDLDEAWSCPLGGCWVFRPAADAFFLGPIDVSVHPHPALDGVTTWLLRGAAFRTSRERRLFYQATHDPVTGLYNRRMFEEQLQREIQRQSQRNSPLALLVCEIDGIRDAASTHGYRCADNVMLAVANRIADEVHDDGLLARIGDAEFGLAFPGTPVAMAVLAAERIIAAVKSMPPCEFAPEVSLSASVGVAVFPEAACSPVTLLVAADRAMCAAQRSGCGCVVAPVMRPTAPATKGA